MKLILLVSILFSTMAAAQTKAQIKGLPNIDTMMVRDITFKIESWDWLVGENANSKFIKLTTAKAKPKKAARATAPATTITIGKIPASEVMDFYRAINRASYGVAKDIAADIIKVIKSKKNLVIFIKQYDDRMADERASTQRRGRAVQSDNQ